MATVSCENSVFFFDETLKAVTLKDSIMFTCTKRSEITVMEKRMKLIFLQIGVVAND